MGIIQAIKKSGYWAKSKTDIETVQAIKIFKGILHLIHTLSITGLLVKIRNG
jgi:hypothetical protein